jgi:hypothetical protein
MRLRTLAPSGFKLVVLALVLGAAAVLTLSPSIARACGGFFSRKVIEGPRRPSLAYEQTLIIFDQAKQREHFIREVAFRAAAEPFGFVVPAPARPEVASLKSPFESLHREFPYGDLGLGLVGTTGGGMPTRSRSAGVTVLEVKKVGSFTSFVLAADDESALTNWLSKNGFSTTPESDKWLSHYVRMKFFYVAMRYEPPPGPRAAPDRTSAETVRISFDTPVAYYPYFEPDPTGGKAPESPRMLEMWLVSPSRSIPVAARTAGGEITWVRPMAAGKVVSTNAQSKLKKAFDAAYELLPAGPLYIQRFIDQKRSRVGYGDVLFVPAEAGTPNVSAMRPLFPILDPTLANAAQGAAP